MRCTHVLVFFVAASCWLTLQAVQADTGDKTVPVDVPVTESENDDDKSKDADGKIEATNPDEENREDDVPVQIEVTHKVENCERRSAEGDLLSIHYVGTLENGVKFDSSRDSGNPVQFSMGAGEVVKGWEKGMMDMCVGEKRKLIIPPHLGYGDEAMGDIIPANSVLYFDVELMDLKDTPIAGNVFKEIDTDDDNQLTQEEISDFIKKQEGDKKFTDEELDSHDKMIADIFKEEDANKDGVISHEEFSGPKHDEL